MDCLIQQRCHKIQKSLQRYITKPDSYPYTMNKVIQNYVLLQKIGQGQYGNVYKSENKKSRQLYAVKVMNVQKFKNTPKLSEFTNNEITILSKINHPNIIKFIEMLRTTNNYYLVYEYCNGGTLAEHIKAKKRLSEEEAVKIFLQIRSAFETLSAENILHRDLKPTNILFHNGVLKVADFGFCKELLKQTDMTQTMVGSPIYMAPQVLKGLIYDSRADIWSMGVILYQMLYGVCPYEESSIPKLVSLIDNTMLKFPPQVKVSDNIKNLIKRMLTIKYRDRISPSQLIKYRLTGNQEQSQKKSQAFVFKQVSRYIRLNLLYLTETLQILAPSVDDIIYLRLSYLTYKILAAFMKETNSGTSYWEMLKIIIPEEKWSYVFDNQMHMLRGFAEQLKEGLMRTDQSVQTRIQLQTNYIGPKYYMELVDKIDDNQLKERLYNCLLINKHFINVLERKNPDFTDFINLTSSRSLIEKEEICKRFAKSY